MPLGLAPKSCRLGPVGGVASSETSVQVPTSWSLSDFCWATALPGSRASPNAVMAARLRMLRRFIGVLRGCLDRHFRRAAAHLRSRSCFRGAYLARFATATILSPVSAGVVYLGSSAVIE